MVYWQVAQFNHWSILQLVSLLIDSWLVLRLVNRYISLLGWLIDGFIGLNGWFGGRLASSMISWWVDVVIRWLHWWQIGFVDLIFCCCSFLVGFMVARPITWLSWDSLPSLKINIEKNRHSCQIKFDGFFLLVTGLQV